MKQYRIEFLKSAQKELSKLPRDVQKRITVKLDALLKNPYPPDAKKLKNGNGRFRIRVGNYRLIYRIEDERLVILVVKVGHRQDVYN